jgi:hypothetical protein
MVIGVVLVCLCADLCSLLLPHSSSLLHSILSSAPLHTFFCSILPSAPFFCSAPSAFFCLIPLLLRPFSIRLLHSSDPFHSLAPFVLRLFYLFCFFAPLHTSFCLIPLLLRPFSILLLHSLPHSIHLLRSSSPLTFCFILLFHSSSVPFFFCPIPLLLSYILLLYSSLLHSSPEIVLISFFSSSSPSL